MSVVSEFMCVMFIKQVISVTAGPVLESFIHVLFCYQTGHSIHAVNLIAANKKTRQHVLHKAVIAIMSSFLGILMSTKVVCVLRRFYILIRLLQKIAGANSKRFPHLVRRETVIIP
jgi:cation transporter-like permease